MSAILLKGVIRSGRVEVAVPIDLPDGSEVMITGRNDAGFSDDDQPMGPSEIARTLAAMELIEPFDMTDEERASAEAWEKRVNDYNSVDFNAIHFPTQRS